MQGSLEDNTDLGACGAWRDLEDGLSGALICLLFISILQIKTHENRLVVVIPRV